jgi:hypothetical protein
MIALPRNALVWVAASATAVALVLTTWPIKTTFDIISQTEGLQLETVGGVRPRWYLEQARLFAGPAAKEIEPFTGSVEIEPGANVIIQRIGQGPLRIACNSRKPTVAVARLYDQDDEYAATIIGHLVVRIDDLSQRIASGQSIVLPIVGKARLGSVIGLDSSRSPTLVREGKVSLLGHSFLGRSLFQAGRFELDPGDSVVVDGGESFIGLVIINEGTALTTVLRTIGRRARVERFGAQGYDLRVSILSRITNDGPLQAVWATSLALISFIKLFRGKDGE